MNLFISVQLLCTSPYILQSSPLFSFTWTSEFEREVRVEESCSDFIKLFSVYLLTDIVIEGALDHLAQQVTASSVDQALG